MAEEVHGFTRYLFPPDRLCCPNTSCGNHTILVATSAAYYRFGTPEQESAAGLEERMPLRRIAKITELNAVTLYGKIDFLY